MTPAPAVPTEARAATAPARGVPARGAAAPRRAMPGGSETLLLVEDDDSIRELTAAVLRRLGYTVLEAACGAEAEALVSGRGEPVALLVTDVSLPGMSGITLAALLRQVQPGLRVLFASGSADALMEARGTSGTTVIQKPYSLDAFACAVRLTLDEPRSSGEGRACRVRL